MRHYEQLRRVAQSVIGASVAGGAMALLEATWARASATSVGLGRLFLGIWGLTALPLIVLGLAVGAFTVWLEPDEAPSGGSLVRRLRRNAVGRQSDFAALVPLAITATFFWTTLLAHIARRILGLAISPKLAGFSMMAAALALGLLLGLVALSFVPTLRRLLATWSTASSMTIDPAATGGASVVVVLALFVFGMLTGTVSGDGGFFGIYGIFKRPELDLRPPFEVLVSAVTAIAAQRAFSPPRSVGPVALSLVTLLGVAPAGLSVMSARSMQRDASLSAAIERGAPLSRIFIGPYRRGFDRDHDGFASAFGGGDCDDANARIHPGAEELLDNGLDEDCSGSDLSARVLEALVPQKADAKVDHRLFRNDLNVVLISVDTLRADLGFAGYQRPITPNIDALAARSVIFEQSYSLASYTGKSIGPTLIGKYGSETHRNWGHFNKFSEEDTFLAERLKRVGVHTMAVHAHRYFDDFGGLDRGFEIRDFSAAPPKEAPWDVDTRSTSEELSNAAIALLGKEENTRGRFFLWVHYLDPHADYLRHEGVEFGRNARDLYDGEVAFTDQHIGRLLETIRQAPFGERTAIIVTSDHGEAFGEHNMYRHGFEVWEPLVRVPLIVYVPGIKAKRVSIARSLIDLAPTILELMLVDLPKSAPPSPDFLSGESLLVDVVTDREPKARDIFVDMPAGPYNDARRAFISGAQKLIISGEARYELYDLKSDPAESKNLIETAEAASIKERYAAFRSRLREIQVTGKKK